MGEPESQSGHLAREEQVQWQADAMLGLAARGWTTPVWVNGDTALRILGTGDPDQIDAAFIEYYSSDSSRMYERISTDLRCWPIRQWLTLVDQVDAAYRRGDYAIVVPAALVLLEGVMMRADANSIDVKDAIRSRIPKQDAHYSYWHAAWKSLSRFVDGLYSRVDFAGAEPCTINRHWILHGRSSAEWTQADCLRILQACVVFARLESLRPRPDIKFEVQRRL